MVTVRVPASTANLGPGFDCLGCAMSLYLRCRFEHRPAGVVEISGCPPEYRSENNLIYRAFCRPAHLGLPPAGTAIEISSIFPSPAGWQRLPPSPQGAAPSTARLRVRSAGLPPYCPDGGAS